MYLTCYTVHMKKMFSICLGLSLSVLLTLPTYVLAQTDAMGSFVDQILWWIWSNTFGYIGTNVIVKSVSPTQVVIESPVIRDEDENDVLKYVVWYGQYPLSHLIDPSSGVSSSDFNYKEFTFASHTGQTFTMTLTEADGIVPSQLYYASVSPINDDENSGQMSWPDICFRMSTSQLWVGQECATLGSNQQHGSAPVNMSLANIWNTCTNNQITLTWNALQGADTVRIYRVVNGQQWTLLAEKNMSDQQHTYTRSSTLEVLRFVPINNGSPVGTEFDYTIRCQVTPPATTTPPQTQTPPPGVTTVPKVGPAQDIAYVLFATLFIYGVIRLRKYRKAK